MRRLWLKPTSHMGSVETQKTGKGDPPPPAYQECGPPPPSYDQITGSYAGQSYENHLTNHLTNTTQWNTPACPSCRCQRCTCLVSQTGLLKDAGDLYSFAESSVSEDKQKAFLAGLQPSIPKGIQDEILHSCKVFPLRIWIIDNSGSMATKDGHKLVATAKTQGLEACTRWEELGDTILYHATLAAFLEAPTEFRLLNAPSVSSYNLTSGSITQNPAPQILRCGYGNPEKELAAVKLMLRSEPTGRTPGCTAIGQAIRRVQEEGSRLRARGGRCAVVIASDGEATDGNMAEAMRPLVYLPVLTVVRLCTNESKVVRYWSAIDKDLELDLDVLDDFGGESREVGVGNRWLTYGMPLHRLREWGTARKALDWLDESSMSSSQMRDVVELIAGQEPARLVNLSDCHLWKDFEQGINQINASLGPVWDPVRRRMRPWFSIKKLRRRFWNQSRCVIA